MAINEQYPAVPALDSIRVYWTEGGQGADPFAADYRPGENKRGTLTTTHSASSYGMPVVVGDDGNVYGPAEIEGDIRDLQGYTDTTWGGLREAAERAGYKTSSSVMQ